MRELAGELERKKKLRKKEERREAEEREKENRKCFFNERRERSVFIYLFIFLTFDLQCTSKDRCAL